jgi:putative hemolysin
MDLLSSTDISLLIILVLASLLFSAFFSGMEIAFISANRLKVELDKHQGGLASRIISSFVAKPKQFIATMLVGNNISIVVYSLATAELLVRIITGIGNQTGWSWVAWLEPEHHYWSSMLIRTLITTIIVLFAAEFIPKALLRVNPNRWLQIFAVPLKTIYFILWVPASFVMSLSNIFIKTVFRGQDEQEQVSFGKVDLDHYLQLATGNADSEEELDHEIQILQNALDFSNVKARDCMIPRNEIRAHNVNDKLTELSETFIQTGMSKVLIFRDSIDNIIGYVHSFELFKKPESIKSILLPVAIVPEPMPANEVLEILIQQKRNMAVVMDEFGGTSGIITMEDIVEEIFGEIEDEHDLEVLIENQISDTEYLFSARHEIDYLNDRFKIGLPESDEYETLGGLLIHLCEEIPEKNKVVIHGTFTFEIRKSSSTRVEEVKLTIGSV